MKGKLTIIRLLELMERKNVTLVLESDYSGHVEQYPQSEELFDFSNEQELLDGLNKLKDFE